MSRRRSVKRQPSREASRRVSRRSTPDGRNDLIERVTIDTVAPTGEGVSTLADGQKVFVSGALAGEHVEVSFRRRSGVMHGELRQVLTASRFRVAPPCPIAARCGGCDFMHIEVAAQRRLHVDAVKSRLGRVADLSSLPEVEVHSPTTALQYRTRARVFVEAGRGRPRVGFRSAGSHRLVNVDECLVLHPELSQLLGELPELIGSSQGEGEATLARGIDGLGVISLRWRGELSAESFATADDRVRTGRWAGVEIWPQAASEPVQYGDPRARVAGYDGQQLVVAAGGFAQASDAGAIALADGVSRMLGQSSSPACSKGRAMELFAGSGTLTVAIAPLLSRLVAVESSPQAAACLRTNLAARGLDAKVREADANTVAIAPSVQTVVLDPPRTGAAGLVATLARSRPRRVLYVSCNPATLARDLSTLVAADYRIVALELFELFPQTSHVEVLVLLQR
jgi:23S rRNA (uracil1939-C5)-methyltransferase